MNKVSATGLEISFDLNSKTKSGQPLKYLLEVEFILSVGNRSLGIS